MRDPPQCGARAVSNARNPYMRPVLHPGYSILSGRAFRPQPRTPEVTLADRPTGAGQPKRNLVAEWLRARPCRTAAVRNTASRWPPSATAFPTRPCGAANSIWHQNRHRWKIRPLGMGLRLLRKKIRKPVRRQHDHLAVGGSCTNFEHLRETKDLAAFLLLV